MKIFALILLILATSLINCNELRRDKNFETEFLGIHLTYK